jgi:hypothetical protein
MPDSNIKLGERKEVLILHYSGLEKDRLNLHLWGEDTWLSKKDAELLKQWLEECLKDG